MEIWHFVAYTVSKSTLWILFSLNTRIHHRTIIIHHTTRLIERIKCQMFGLYDLKMLLNKSTITLMNFHKYRKCLIFKHLTYVGTAFWNFRVKKYVFFKTRTTSGWRTMCIILHGSVAHRKRFRTPRSILVIDFESTL